MNRPANVSIISRQFFYDVPINIEAVDSKLCDLTLDPATCILESEAKVGRYARNFGAQKLGAGAVSHSRNSDRRMNCASDDTA